MHLKKKVYLQCSFCFLEVIISFYSCKRTDGSSATATHFIAAQGWNCRQTVPKKEVQENYHYLMKNRKESFCTMLVLLVGPT